MEECHFTNPDEHIIDALIFGSNSKCTRMKLLEKDATLTLDTAQDIARTESITSKQIKGISNDVSTHVDALKHGLGSSKAESSCSKPCGPIIRFCGCCGIEHDIFGLEKFHYYAYGTPVVVECDHKPLETMFKKHLAIAPPCIARMTLCIQRLCCTNHVCPLKGHSLC